MGEEGTEHTVGVELSTVRRGEGCHRYCDQAGKAPRADGRGDGGRVGEEGTEHAVGVELSAVRRGEGYHRYCGQAGKDPRAVVRRARILELMDEEMVDVWERRGLSTLWELNCLQYAGAKAVTDIVRTDRSVEVRQG